jgi:hypothetical protein
VVFLDSMCGTTPGRGHDEERLVRERAAAVRVLDDPSFAVDEGHMSVEVRPGHGASGAECEHHW